MWRNPGLGTIAERVQLGGDPRCLGLPLGRMPVGMAERHSREDQSIRDRCRKPALCLLDPVAESALIVGRIRIGAARSTAPGARPEPVADALELAALAAGSAAAVALGEL
jgi:hypothetical protein